MIIRVQNTKNRNVYLIIDEIERVVGEILDFDFPECLLEKESFEENGYTWFYADKNCLKKYLR